jgi:uncharacterized protein YfaS (alpha-2-macroglobulin family)
VAPGDAFTVPVSAFNRTQRDGAAELSWTLDGLVEGSNPFQGQNPPQGTSEFVGPTLPDDSSAAAGLVFAAMRTASIDVPAGGSARAAFTLRASEKAGKASARLDARLGDEAYFETVELPVRPAAPRVERTRSGSVTAEKPLELSASSGFLAGTSRWRLVVSSFPDIELAGSLKYLLDYPHGCIEQTTSRAFPLLYMKDLADLSGIGSYTPASTGPGGRIEAVGDYVLAGIQRVLEMQAYGGWFGTWPGSREPWPWASVYATHFLLEAKAAGYPVPDLELEAALLYVREEIVKGRRRESHPDILERAYGLYVLAVAKKPDTGSMDRLREEAMALPAAAALAGTAPPAPGAQPTAPAPSAQTSFPASARFLLAGAYMLSSQPEAARSVLGDDLPAPGEARDTGGVLRSPAREAAILLSTLVDSDPSDPRVTALIHRLKSCRVRDRWGTTQETAFALLALGKYARHRAKTPEDYRAEVAVVGQPPIELAAGESRELHGESLEGGVRVSLKGSGQLFYWWSEEGVPADGKVEEVDAGIKVRRRFLDRAFSAVSSSSLPLGEMVIVEISLDADDALENVVVTDMLPAGLEVENPRLGGAAVEAGGKCLLEPRHVSLRDDRVIAFFDLGWRKHGVFYYATRAITRGEFALPPIEAEAMYQPGTRSISGAGRVIVR